MTEDRMEEGTERAAWMDHQIDLVAAGHHAAVAAAARMRMSLKGKMGEADVAELILLLEERRVADGLRETLERSLDAFQTQKRARANHVAGVSDEEKVANAIGLIRDGLQGLDSLNLDFRLTFAPNREEAEPPSWWASFELMGHVHFDGLVRTPRGRYPALVTVVNLHEPPQVRHVGRSAVFQITERTAEEAAQRLTPYGAEGGSPIAEIAHMMRHVADDKVHWSNLREIVGEGSPAPFDQDDEGGA